MILFRFLMQLQNTWDRYASWNEFDICKHIKQYCENLLFMYLAQKKVSHNQK